LRARQIYQKAGDPPNVAAEVEAGVEVELLELAKVNLTDEEFSEKGITVACCGVDGVHVHVQVASEHAETKNAAHVAVGGVELALLQDGRRVSQDSAVPAQRLRFWHGMPGMDYVVCKTVKLMRHAAL
jgi:hypothetical protein